MVESNAPEVLDALAQSFRDMSDVGTGALVGRVSVVRDGSVYHVPADGEESVRGGSLDDALRCARYHVARCFIEANPDLLWLHAAGARAGDKTILLAGPSGRGKSSLVTELCARGWAYLSDEVVALDPRSRIAFPFPQAPTPRAEPTRWLSEEELRDLPKPEAPLAPSVASNEPSVLGAIVFPIYAPGAPVELRRCVGAEAAVGLLESCLNFVTHRQRAVREACALATDLPTYRLTYSVRADAASAIDAMLR